MVMLADSGIGYSLPTAYLTPDVPMQPKKLGLLQSGEHFASIIPAESSVLVFTKKGKVRHYRVEFRDTWQDHAIAPVDDDDQIVSTVITDKYPKGTSVVVITAKGQVLRFPLDNVKSAGMGSGGIAGMNLNDGDDVVKVMLAKPSNERLITLSKRSIKSTPLNDIPEQTRGKKGSRCHVMLGNDVIIDAVIDGHVVQNNKMVAIPKDTPRAGKFAPAIKTSLTL
jgi:DNA gyrase/topoisomerase IV subunit A